MANQVRRIIHYEGWFLLNYGQKTEQMSIVVRFLDPDALEIKELFVPATSLNAESLIVDTLKLFIHHPQKLVSQGYGGASVMSGHCTGVQQRMREVAPHAIYIHCHAHIC